MLDLNSAATRGHNKYKKSCQASEATGEQIETRDSDSEVDDIWLEASLQHEAGGRFPMISDEDIEREVRSSVPQKTTKQTNWCFGVWKLWRESRLESKDVQDHPPELLSMSDDDLCKWMIKFLYEARKKADGSEYRG